MISVNFYIIFIPFYFIMFCPAPLSSIVSGSIQIHCVIVIDWLSCFRSFACNPLYHYSLTFDLKNLFSNAHSHAEYFYQVSLRHYLY